MDYEKYSAAEKQKNLWRFLDGLTVFWLFQNQNGGFLPVFVWWRKVRNLQETFIFPFGEMTVATGKWPFSDGSDGRLASLRGNKDMATVVTEDRFVQSWSLQKNSCLIHLESLLKLDWDFEKSWILRKTWSNIESRLTKLQDWFSLCSAFDQYFPAKIESRLTFNLESTRIWSQSWASLETRPNQP